MLIVKCWGCLTFTRIFYPGDLIRTFVEQDTTPRNALITLGNTTTCLRETLYFKIALKLFIVRTITTILVQTSSGRIEVPEIGYISHRVYV